LVSNQQTKSQTAFWFGWYYSRRAWHIQRAAFYPYLFICGTLRLCRNFYIFDYTALHCR
jgi:hypothetical protein